MLASQKTTYSILSGHSKVLSEKLQRLIDEEGFKTYVFDDCDSEDSDDLSD